jgi:hypothetical protein
MSKTNSTKQSAPKETKDTKAYLEVVAEYDKNGVLMPRRIISDDDEDYSVTRVLSVKPSISLLSATRYSVIINKQRFVLYLEEIAGEHKWFIRRN